ncbi:MAG: hypothetical protein JWQ49_2208 [Edaphobacter sp.]|nr:hypothetical protein [Edaphobacter sp.]
MTIIRIGCSRQDGLRNGDTTEDILLTKENYPRGGCKMIRKLKTGEFRIYSRHQDPKTGRRKNLGTFATREKAQEHEKAIQYFKRH